MSPSLIIVIVAAACCAIIFRVNHQLSLNSNQPLPVVAPMAILAADALVGILIYGLIQVI